MKNLVCATNESLRLRLRVTLEAFCLATAAAKLQYSRPMRVFVILLAFDSWATTMLELVEGTNYISFDYRFDGAGEGQLAVYLNEELIFIADQRISANAAVESGFLPVGHLLEEYNYLSVRLDPLGAHQAGIWISNIESGVVMVPEPAVVTLAPLVALALLARRKASQRILSKACERKAGQAGDGLPARVLSDVVEE